MNRSEQLYFDWLVRRVCTVDEKAEYSLLLMHLHDTTFVSFDEFDDNLVENSMDLRDEFLKSSRTGLKYYEIYGGFEFECTILELLVYLSVKIEDEIMTNDDFGERYSVWFWTMIDNLGLKFAKNSYYDEEKVCQILENFIEKRYKRNGKGGLFVINSSKIDAKELDIWSQAMSFLTKFVKSDGEIY